MGIVQDTLLGASLMTRDDTFIDRSTAMRLVGWIRYPEAPWHELLPEPAVLHPKRLWTGRQVFSMLLPRFLCYSKASAGVLVREGVLLSGTMSKQTLGTSNGSLVDLMYREFGAQRVVWFMSDVQRVVNE